MAERRTIHRLGKNLVGGARLRSLPQIELPWITTFNLRWWRHAEDEVSNLTKQPHGKAGMPT